MSTALTQLLEILQAHGLMERSDERFLSAQDLVELNEHLALIETYELTEYRRASYGSGPQPRSVDGVIRDLRAQISDLRAQIRDLRAQIRALEERIDDARAALG